MNHQTSSSAVVLSDSQDRLRRLVQRFGLHEDWQNTFRFALGELQNTGRHRERNRLVVWLLQAGNPYRVLDSLNTDNLYRDRDSAKTENFKSTELLPRLTRWLVHLDWTGSTNFSSEWSDTDERDIRPALSEVVVDDVRVADVVASLLRPEVRDSRLLIAAWELLEPADRVMLERPEFAALRAARASFLSEFLHLVEDEDEVALTLLLPSNPPANGRPNYRLCEAIRDFPVGDKIDNDGRRQTVTLDEFHLQTTPVTTQQYALFDPGHEQRFGNYKQYSPDPDCPVIYVNWHMARLFCQWLSGPALDDPGWGPRYDLPSESEWEYACRAGERTEQDWCCGNDEQQLKEYAWYSANAGQRTHPVGEKKANAFGLYDMHGNVWEWCRNRYADKYESARPTNSEGPNKEKNRVLRGGGVWNYSRNCRSAYRYWNQPAYVGNDAGFRVLCLPASQD